MDWLAEHPEVRTIRVAAADLNGVPRGKRVPARFAGKLLTEGTKFPYSVLNMDIWGEDIENSPLVFETGDPDALLMPTERGFMPMPWLDAPSALLPLWMFHPDGRPYDGDPRQALARVVDRYKAAGLTAVVVWWLAMGLLGLAWMALWLRFDPQRRSDHAGKVPFAPAIVCAAVVAVIATTLL